MYGVHLSVVPSDRDRVPTCSNDGAAIIGITTPTYPISFYEFFGFASGHVGLHRLGDGIRMDVEAGIRFATRRTRFSGRRFAKRRGCGGAELSRWAMPGFAMAVLFPEGCGTGDGSLVVCGTAFTGTLIAVPRSRPGSSGPLLSPILTCPRHRLVDPHLRPRHDHSRSS